LDEFEDWVTGRLLAPSHGLRGACSGLGLGPMSQESIPDLHGLEGVFAFAFCGQWEWLIELDLIVHFGGFS